MATKKEIKSFLTETGYTEDDMQKFWEDNLDTNFVIRNLNSHRMTWKDLNISCIRKLPTQKERDLEYLEKKKVEEAEKEKLEQEKKEKEEYIKNHFDEYILNKIDNKEELDEYELKKMTWNYQFKEEDGEIGRWTQSMSTYVKLKDRFFRIDWECGLTEYQENEYPYQPVEVRKVEYDKLIPEHYEHIVEWKVIE